MWPEFLAQGQEWVRPLLVCRGGGFPVGSNVTIFDVAVSNDVNVFHSAHEFMYMIPLDSPSSGWINSSKKLVTG